MATAEVHDVTPQEPAAPEAPRYPNQDEISASYSKLTNELAVLQARADFWRETLKHPEFQAKIKGMRREIDRETMDLRDVAPKFLIKAQAEVKAKLWIVNQLVGVSLADELRSKIRAINEMRMNYPLILRAAGIDIDASLGTVLDDAPPIDLDGPQDDEDEIDGITDDVAAASEMEDEEEVLPTDEDEVEPEEDELFERPIPVDPEHVEEQTEQNNKRGRRGRK